VRLPGARRSSSRDHPPEACTAAVVADGLVALYDPDGIPAALLQATRRRHPENVAPIDMPQPAALPGPRQHSAARSAKSVSGRLLPALDALGAGSAGHASVSAVISQGTSANAGLRSLIELPERDPDPAPSWMRSARRWALGTHSERVVTANVAWRVDLPDRAVGFQ
jgi:hypothetical protein